MYTLRSITKTGLQRNESLGLNYTLIHRFYNYEEFQRNFKFLFDKDHVADDDLKSDGDTKDTYAFVVSENGGQIFPLYKSNDYYIMTDNGKTFDNLSYKNS
jgi:hypothetical protein